jgi:hypothetical protein
MPYRTIAWLCKNHVRIGVLENYDDGRFWDLLRAGILLYMMEHCDLTDLSAVYLDFTHVEQNADRYESSLAVECGIPYDFINDLIEGVHGSKFSVMDVQKRFFELIGTRAHNLHDLQLHCCITESTDVFNLNVVSYNLMTLPLRNLSLVIVSDENDENEHENTDAFDHSSILSEAIESLHMLKFLLLYLPFSCCSIRSKSLQTLEFRARNELVQCKCPALENLSVVLKDSVTSQLLSDFTHSIRQLDIHFDYDVPEFTTSCVRLTEIIQGMASLEELNVLGVFSGEFGLDIKSNSLRKIDLLGCFGNFQLSCCHCPNLESLKCNYSHAALKPCPLSHLDPSRKLDALVLADSNKWKRIKFRDCPLDGCQVPEDCLFEFLLKHVRHHFR